jgi:flagellin-like protein
MDKKGITPVIAVVLLLLITVGAVGSAFGLYQELVNSANQRTEQLDASQRAAQTDLNFVSTFNQSVNSNLVDPSSSSQNDTTRFTIRNSGSRAIDLEEEMRLEFQPPSEPEPMAASQFQQIYGSEWNANADPSSLEVRDCFSNMASENSTLAEEAEYTCTTNVDFPNVGEEIVFSVNYLPSDKSWEKVCAPSSVTARTC